MTAEARVTKTPAETGLTEQFAATKVSLAGNTAVLARREKAFAVFEEKGLPHRRIEEWHYTDLRGKMRNAFAMAAGASGADKSDLEQALAIDSYKVVIQNGLLVVGLSDLGELEAGLTVRSLKASLEAGEEDVLNDDGLVDDAAVLLNSAFAQDGISISVAENVTLSKPLQILHVSSEGETCSYPRHDLQVGNGANATIIESFVGASEASYQVNTLSKVFVGDKAKVLWVKLQKEAADAQHISSFAATVGADSDFSHFTITTGSSLSRNQIWIKCAGEGSTIGCRGISMLNQKQHADVTLLVDHAVPSCDSREFYKSVVDDQSHSVFQGKIIVAPDSQKTDGQMMVQSLVLNDDAQVSVKPELEIFADDVQCAHGATTGDIDEDLLFYLRARGIPEKQARHLLIIAFLAEVIEELDNEAVIEVLEAEVRSWLGTEEV
ncbi:Fe-S cluster assembly protein SufD [Flexibacterium corallicola]|uniref:Fe-S cluster assembly protein SufD n=1 Tax=Flexibacterium corallicola TaxID=3037259 RepID=UPI00286F2AF4|nr:Fe-S cluster assembly protein SufD [Pseudovibrio sp. M1P-2-3]